MSENVNALKCRLELDTLPVRCKICPKYIILSNFKMFFLSGMNCLISTLFNKAMENHRQTLQPLTLSLIRTLSDASEADGFLKTLWQKKKLLKTSNFSFCHNVFHFQSQVIHSIIEIFYFLTKYVQSRLLQNCRMRERVNA